MGCCGSTGIAHAECGCGEDLFLCYPRYEKGKVISAVGLEFQNRGVHAYNEDLSWTEVFGGDKFYGNRWLYHHYLYQQDFAITSRTPPASVPSSPAARRRSPQCTPRPGAP